MKLEINKIVTLGNNEEYLIVDKVEKDGKEYYYVAQVNEDETDIEDISNIDEKNLRVLRELIYDGQPSVEDVTDPDLFKLIVKYTGLEEE